jgi:hypothetical protein
MSGPVTGNIFQHNSGTEMVPPTVAAMAANNRLICDKPINMHEKQSN